MQTQGVQLLKRTGATMLRLLSIVVNARRQTTLLSMFFCVAVHSQSSWLTVAGFPGDTQTDVLEVDALSRQITPGGPLLNIRVSRVMLRSSTEGIPFRSYTATVLVDCAAGSARFVTASFYMMPFWEGKPHKTVDYSPTEVRPVLFRFFKPNPLPRIVTATCAVSPR